LAMSQTHVIDFPAIRSFPSRQQAAVSEKSSNPGGRW
jgi:hypothetical protein